jgi:multimeric flavodoxin WrbA
MKVLGVSGSPVLNSNTDRALAAVLDATGVETEFIKLSDYSIAPCLACLGCVQTNRCVIEDDGQLLAEKAKAADALVVAGFTPYSSLDARSKTFLERLYPLRHNHGFMAGKPGAAVITSAIPDGCEQLPPAAEMGVNTVMYYMLEEGMRFVGSLKVQGNVPCIRCGVGDDCKMSGIGMIFGPNATVDSVGINSFALQPENVAAAGELGRQLAEALGKKG